MCCGRNYRPTDPVDNRASLRKTTHSTLHATGRSSFTATYNSIAQHNTLIYRAGSYTAFGNPGGQIDLDAKSGQPGGTGTHVFDNVTTSVDFSNGSTGTQDHNVSGQTATYVGGAVPTTFPGFALAANSSVGLGAASDGTNIGIELPTGYPYPR